MRILDRHVLTETALAGGMATGAFLFVMVAGNFLQQVAGAIATGRVDGAQGLELVILLFPGVTPYALPMGMLAGVLMAFGRMGAQHEITAMKASGRGLVRIARPALLLAAALAAYHQAAARKLFPMQVVWIFGPLLILEIARVWKQRQPASGVK